MKFSIGMIGKETLRRDKTAMTFGLRCLFGVACYEMQTQAFTLTARLTDYREGVLSNTRSVISAAIAGVSCSDL
jgi:uncharacterized membrane protein YbjE (DUF340 family)